MRSNILIVLVILVSSNLFYAQENTNQKSILNKSVPGVIKTRADITSMTSQKSSTPADWQIIMTEDFEGTFPNGNWSVFPISGFADAYWGKILLSDTTYAVWCASSGSEASTWSAGYVDSMNAWMTYGPFDLSDATDATLAFDYYNDLEPDFDSLRILASEDGHTYYGFSLFGNSNGWQFYTLDLKDIPVIGDLTGKNGIYIGFRFVSDESNPQTYRGTLIDNVILIKFVETSASVPTVTTNSATNVTENSATLNGTVNPNNSSTTVVFEYGTSAAYGSEIAAAQSPVNGDSAVSVSANLNVLQSNTTYHYRVRATNSVGVSGGTDVTFTTSSSTSAPLATTNSATNITSSSATLNGTVNPNNASTTVVFEYGISASYGSEITAAQSPVVGNSAVSVSANLSGLQSNTTYHYRIKGTNSVGVSNGADITFTTSQSSSNTISLNNNFTFNDPTQSSSYRMIGLPGDNNLPPTQIISGTQKTEWNMFYDNGAAENYFEEYDGSAKFNFTPGKGFWVLSKNTISINKQVNSVTLAGDDTYSINLHNGWNIITNPFDESVSLDNIKFFNDNLPANATLWKFNGNFSQSTSLDPYEGYYFDNETNLASLKIPLSSIIILPKANEQAYYLSEKNLTLKLSTEEFSSMVKIGFDPSSSNDYDEMDYMIPPGDFEVLRINIVNNNLSTSHKQLFIEHRPQVGEGQKFELQVKNNTNKKADLLVEGIENFNGHEIYLVDESLKKFYDLKTMNKIEIRGNQSNQFSLLIGNSNFINTYKDNSVPTEFALYQNYPNPFNPSTFIRYQVPRKMHVSIKVIDVLGNLIKTLVDEVKNEGYYEDVWDASNQPSGVYFYQIKTARFTETKKMILVK